MIARPQDATDPPQGARAGPADYVRSILDRAHEAFVAMDAAGRVIDWNPQAQRTFGWSRDEAIGRVLAELFIPDREREAHRQGLQRYLQTGIGPLLDKRIEVTAVDRSGREFPVEMTISADPAPDVARFYAFLHDITERRRGERLLLAQHAIARVFAEARTTEDAIRRLLAELGEAMDWQFGAWWSPDEEKGVLRCRAVWRRGPAVAAEFEQASLSLELGRGEGLPGRVWESGEPAWTADFAADASFPRARAAVRGGLHAALCVPLLRGSDAQGAIEFFSTRDVEPDETMRQILGAVASQITGFVSLLTERSELVGRLERLALTDELTSLDNRRGWEASLEREHARARREGHPLCVAIFDLDQFKRYNDAHGHQAGDELLREIARRWRAQLRVSDVLARYGGEEFALLCPARRHADVLTVVERLRACLPAGQTCSAGLAASDGAETAPVLVGRADTALYRAKAAGRDRTVTAD